ncbi:MAG: beta-lactamase family protein [Acidobacteria bacterium]|nr:beta-lactamase family protein [Acidobacteriota bacterium]
MSPVVQPTQQQLQDLATPYLQTSAPIAIVIGYASPSFQGLHFQGNLVDQQRNSMTLGGLTPFELASVTKTFTAALYGSYIQAGWIHLDTLLSDILPDGQSLIGPQFLDIPLLTLGNYTSGLPQDNNDGSVDEPSPLPSPYTVKDLFAYLVTTDLQPSPPNQTYTYSNLAFALLAEVISYAMGPEPTSSSSSLFQQLILQPLGLNGTQMYDPLSSGLPVGFLYLDCQTGAPVAAKPGWPPFPAYNGAGGLVSTPDDMMTWLLFNMGLVDNPPLTALLYFLQSPSTNVIPFDNSQLGVGWFLTSVSNGTNTLNTVWKDGDLDGFSSYIALLQSPQPGTKPSEAGVFVLTNSNGDAVYNIANDLLFLMTGYAPAADKSRYPRTIRPSALRARRTRPGRS